MNVTPLRASRRSTEPPQAAPRPGGRSAAHDTAALPTRGENARGRYRTSGNAALAAQPLAEEPVRRPRLRLAPPVPVAAPRTPFVLLIVVVVVAGVLGILVLNTKIAESGLQLTELKHKQAQLDLREQQVSQEIAEAESPGRLEAAAKRLGLVPAGAPAFIRLPDGKIIGVPQPATGKPSITSQ
ncbi:hypothetical protein Cs7R123_23010 [Catellatospora sp. TT07R-123]|uniref:hypothetical protein n=1 Tax=Catellatospora sp. TT07R-123 TaxID=2733863 RepID=UPI001B156C57|nr:hypothetical protein [Catellatospora sp. TT07R-123]GHJ44959.1 hypothetical protein Cs7R123_23010 [Catellatospora sp. TT07R-123]